MIGQPNERSLIVNTFVTFQVNTTESTIMNETIATTTEDSSVEGFNNVIKAIRWGFVPFIIIGTVLNITIIIVFFKSKMRSLSTGNFLLALAFADLGTSFFQVRKKSISSFLFLLAFMHKTGNFCCAINKHQKLDNEEIY